MDDDFEHATTWDAVQAVHDRWMGEYNHQLHWAHRMRDDGRETPAEVLAWIYGQVWESTALQLVFHAPRFTRRLDASSYIRFRYWRLYAQPGLARRPVAVWLHKEELTIVVDATELAHYTVEYAPDGTQFRDVMQPQVYDTQYRSPQLPLWQFGDADWLKIMHLPRYIRKRRPQSDLMQAHLFVW